MPLARILAAGGLVLGLLVLPATDARADHRHGPGCGHGGSWSSGYRPSHHHGYSTYAYRPAPYAPYRAYGGYYGRTHVPPAPYYAPAYRPYAPYGYRSGYAPYASPYAAPYGYYGAPGAAVALHFHGGQSCSRSHVSLHIGW